MSRPTTQEILLAYSGWVPKKPNQKPPIKHENPRHVAGLMRVLVLANKEEKCE